MNGPHFAYFIEKFGEATQHTPVPETSFSEWGNKLPPLIIKIWREEGWANYGNDRFWTVNPTDYIHIKDVWLAETPLTTLDTFQVIVRTAFGKLCLCGEKTGAAPLS